MGGGGDSTESLSGIKHDFPISMICLTQFRVPDIPLNSIYMKTRVKYCTVTLTKQLSTTVTRDDKQSEGAITGHKTDMLVRYSTT